MDILSGFQKDNQKEAPASTDTSGTDPNRYSSKHTVAKAELLSQPTTPLKAKTASGLNVNVGRIERMLMVAAGGYLLYRGLTGSKKNVAQSIAGTTMLARGISGYCPVYDAVENAGSMKSTNVNIRTSIRIDKPVHEVYAFWRKLENLPAFMNHLESVTEKDTMHSHWVAKGPAGIGTVSWDAEILMDEKNRILSWHSLPYSTVDNAGKVVFKESNNGGTELDVTISYHAPFGVAGESAAKFLNPYFEKMVKKDIESLKLFLESGTSVN